MELELRGNSLYGSIAVQQRPEHVVPGFWFLCESGVFLSLSSSHLNHRASYTKISKWKAVLNWSSQIKLVVEAWINNNALPAT